MRHLCLSILLLSSTASAQIIPKIRVDATPQVGGAVTSDLDMGGNDIVCSALLADSAPSDLLVKACGAYALASVNTTGGNLNLVGGHGSKSVVVDDYTLCGTETVTLTIVDSDGTETANILTEASEWTAATSDSATCLSLGTAVDAVSGVSADTSACVGSDKLGIVPDAGTARIILSESEATCTTTANGIDGSLWIGSDADLDGHKLFFDIDALGTDTYLEGSAGDIPRMIAGGVNTMQWRPTLVRMGVYLDLSSKPIADDGDGSVTFKLGDTADFESATILDGTVDGTLTITDTAGTTNATLVAGGVTLGDNESLKIGVGTELDLKSDGDSIVGVLVDNTADAFVLGSTGDLALFTVNTDDTTPYIHIQDSDDGGAAVNAATVLRLEGAGSPRISFTTPSTGLPGLNFGDDAQNAGTFVFDHTDDQFEFNHGFVNTFIVSTTQQIAPDDIGSCLGSAGDDCSVFNGSVTTRTLVDNTVSALTIGADGDTAIMSVSTLNSAASVTFNSTLSHAGADPVLSACGTTPTVVGGGSAGKVTIGTGVTTSCTATFAVAFNAAPSCIVIGDQTATTYAATTTTTVLTITSSADMDSDVINYHCIGL